MGRLLDYLGGALVGYAVLVIVGAVFMAALGAFLLGGALPATHGDPWGILALLLLFACFCIPFAYLILPLLLPERHRSKRETENAGDEANGEMPSMSCTRCGKEMRYGGYVTQWVCDKCQTSRGTATGLHMMLHVGCMTSQRWRSPKASSMSLVRGSTPAHFRTAT